MVPEHSLIALSQASNFYIFHQSGNLLQSFLYHIFLHMYLLLQAHSIPD
jgi:hypothetical protein